ncbi:MAG: NAD(P)H-dependent glycerol-3-phosphate dehydrogenase [Pseudorhodobacter sp.]|nr:NAD(P)H-dependent glycerol-3-phosphate dehydrogenase [Pseudorhodobacter sp.]
MSVAILGAGAFGTALAVALGREGPITLWGRGLKTREMERLPGVILPKTVSITADIADITAETVLLALPMQALAGFLADHGTRLNGRKLVACCKGVDLATGLGPTALISRACPDLPPAILTGPSFAADIAHGLPTALTLACADSGQGELLQKRLSTGVLRLYRTTDVAGAELGGALKNVIAIAAGVVIGAGLGDSARAALMTRGYAEMLRLALSLGARAETLAGLSGLGDLVLTCTSNQSRNFRYGKALGAEQAFDASVTVEGVATAKAVSNLAEIHKVDMPIATMVAALTMGRVTLAKAILALFSRPLKPE